MPKKNIEELNKNWELKTQRGYYVAERNDIIQTSTYKLKESTGKSFSLVEKKLLLYLISRIKPDDTELKLQQININDFWEVCGYSQTTNGKYTFIKECIEKLASRVMWLENEKRIVLVRWIDKAYIEKGNSTINIKLDDNLKPYLLNLKENYTQFPLDNIIKMKSKYGIALYEILKSYAYKLKLTIEIDILKEKLDCVNYTDNSNFKKKVINPALNDINTYTDLKVDIEYKKEGKQIKYIVFYIEDLSKSIALEDKEEYARRKHNIEKELDPNQLTLWEILYNKEGDK